MITCITHLLYCTYREHIYLSIKVPVDWFYQVSGYDICVMVI